MCSFYRRTALERVALAAQTHAAAKELNDLRTFLLADIKQAHVGNTPRIPALHEFLRANQDIDQRIGPVDVLEQRTGNDVLLQNNACLVAFHQFFKLGRVADVNESEIIFGADGLQPQLARTAADVAQMQAAAARRVEKPCENVLVQGMRSK